MIHNHPKLCSSKQAQPIIDAWSPWFENYDVGAADKDAESQFHFFVLMNHVNI